MSEHTVGVTAATSKNIGEDHRQSGLERINNLTPYQNNSASSRMTTPQVNLTGLKRIREIS